MLSDGFEVEVVAISSWARGAGALVDSDGRGRASVPVDWRSPEAGPLEAGMLLLDGFEVVGRAAEAGAVIDGSTASEVGPVPDVSSLVDTQPPLTSLPGPAS